MADQNNIINEINDLISWMNESSLFETKRKDNIKILQEQNNQIVENQSSTENQLVKNMRTNSNEDLTILNKKLRCDICKIKISLVDELISTCKCEKKHCSKHRMPESHKCNKLEEIGKEQRKNLELSLKKLDSNFSLVKL